MKEIRAHFRYQRSGFALEVDLDLPGDGITALFGPSGCGKTTLLRLIAGLEHATEGILIIKGKTWQDADCFVPTHRRSLGYVFQEASLFPHLSAGANIRYGMRRTAMPLDSAALEHICRLLDLGELLKRRPAALSGGERQRVAIARALAVNPQILLMDEPLAALDLRRKREIMPYLERLRDELDIPVLYVSHSPDEVARLADHLVILEAGRVVAQGPPGEILARIDLPIRLGEDTGVVLQARVAERDSQWHLLRVDFPGGALWVRDTGQEIGQQVRIRVLARDVSLALSPHGDTSILNILPAEVVEVCDDPNQGQALVRLRLGQSPLVARLTQRSVQHLQLRPGAQVYVQIKAVALVG